MSFHEGDINSTNDERRRLLSVQAETSYDEVVIVHQRKAGALFSKTYKKYTRNNYLHNSLGNRNPVISTLIAPVSPGL